MIENVEAPAQDIVSGFRRQRGITTPRQQTGLALMLDGSVQGDFTAGIFTVRRGSQVNIVDYNRQECSCAQFVKSSPRVLCDDIHSVNYFVEPPSEKEMDDVKELITGQFLKLVKSACPVAHDISECTEDDFAAAQTRIIRGGYKRFASDYDKAIRSLFGKEMRFALGFFENLEGLFYWKKRQPRGRPPKRLSRILFAAYTYTYLGFSVRATEGFMTFLASLGFFGTCNRPDCTADTCPRDDCPRSSIVRFGTLSQFLRSKQATALIRELIALTAEPFRELGPLTLFGDATGIAGERNRFFDYRMQRTQKKKQTRPGRPWFMVLVVGSVDTLHSVAVRVLKKKESEQTVFRNEIIGELESRDYEIEQMLYDGGIKHTMIRDEIIEKLDAIPLIPWSKNSRNPVPRKWRNLVKNVATITELHRMCMHEPEKFKAAGFRFRVKGECLFAQVKELFGSYVRTIRSNGPENEIMLKFLAYNVRAIVLAADIYGLSIESIAPQSAA